MKKVQFIKAVCFSTLLFTLNTTAIAQLEKGNWMVGGSGNLNFSRYSASLNLSPSAGYFIRPKTAIGASLQYGFQYNSLSSLHPKSHSTLGLSPFIRQYLLKPENKFNLFLQAEASLFTSWNSNSDAFLRGTMKIGAGASYFLTPKVALEFQSTFTPRNIGISNYPNGHFNNTLGFRIFF